jgi:hypothetical protein
VGDGVEAGWATGAATGSAFMGVGSSSMGAGLVVVVEAGAGVATG